MDNGAPSRVGMGVTTDLEDDDVNRGAGVVGADLGTDGRVAFVTGGAGTICSAQTRALVALGANACIIGRNQQKTEAAAADIATARKGAKVIGIGGCDVRNVRRRRVP